ncbi:glycosyltransferase family 4 protein [Paraburkholderia sediminicola]|uniref:glycosyltransferase family 4 protein n=1 Tax=Paraburkholderia sediminicola TaxID=458836 RepID=UPI0038BD03EF
MNDIGESTQLSISMPDRKSNAPKKIKALIEMRPALDGFAGIPQETRLLFRALCDSRYFEPQGLLQTSLRFLSRGSEKHDRSVGASAADRLNSSSLAVISLSTKPSKQWLDEIFAYIRRRQVAYRLLLSSLFRGRSHVVRTSLFEARHFGNFVWDAVFSKSLPSKDFSIVTERNFEICSIPWHIFQMAGLKSLKFRSRALYPRLGTVGSAVFIAQTPYPGRVAPGTVLVIRYHDALPIFMPHAFANKAKHHAAHFQALRSNVESGGYFACVSEATRMDLVKVFPELEARTITIHNMVSHQYFREDSPRALVSQILRTSRNEAVCGPLLEIPARYILMVATIEPRKNHARLMSALNRVRAGVDPSLAIVFVGSVGWDAVDIVAQMKALAQEGCLHALHKVPAEQLRVLYRHATVTVSPSIAEGFDFSGVEAMCSGGVVIASDIPVHREIYADAAVYFDPFSAQELAECIASVCYESNSETIRKMLLDRGESVSARYSPEVLLPKWEAFLSRVVSGAA